MASVSLDPSEIDRYARHIVLPEIGGAGQLRLKRAHVAVTGAGGIGCPALLYLAAAGIGRLTVIDDDTVSLANLQRQVLFATGELGQPKALVAAAALARLNPHVETVALTRRIDPASVAGLLAGADLVLDGTDNFATRLLVADAALAMQAPLVSAAIGRFQGQVARFEGWRAGEPCYRCFVGDAFDADDCDSCAEDGVLGAFAGLVGCFAAMEAVRAITGFGTGKPGRLHLVDGLAPAMRSLAIAKDPACRSCGLAAGTGD